MALLTFTSKGIYCKQAKVYIDPWKPVDKALITHAHADHARSGSRNYLCQTHTAPLLKYRLGDSIHIETVDYGEKIKINGVQFSFHPAGHVIGSAQIRVEYQSEVWVVSGDYKIQDDGVCAPFEAIKCQVFITECTFGLPVFNWEKQADVMQEINDWWEENKKNGKASVLSAYSLGKAQRVLQNLDDSIGPIFSHGAIYNTHEVLRASKWKIKDSGLVDESQSKKDFEGALILAPPAAIQSNWMKRFGPHETAAASGWMGLRGTRRRQNLDRGFVLSDHADWKGLNEAIKNTACEKVICTHGYTDVFSRWLNEQGIESIVESAAFEGGEE